jgi:hypothetical protein
MNGIQSLGIEKILVFIGAMQMNIITKSGPDGRIVWGEISIGVQLGICMSGPESSALVSLSFCS